jgi:hypothetical protein
VGGGGDGSGGGSGAGGSGGSLRTGSSRKRSMDALARLRRSPLVGYPDSKPKGVNPWMHGWFSETHKRIFRQIVSEKTKVIVELGSWYVVMSSNGSNGSVRVIVRSSTRTFVNRSSLSSLPLLLSSSLRLFLSSFLKVW